MGRAFGSGSYHATRDALPCSLPTSAEIQSSEDINYNHSDRRVVRVVRDFMVKYGKQVDLEEGRIMLHVSEYTSVPKVYALSYLGR